MKENPLRKLESYGQSIWVDFIRRGMLTSGELKQMMDEDGVSGVTSNPSIFEKAISGSHDYDEAIRALALEGKSAAEMYEALTVDDIQQTADVLRPLYDRLQGRDGFVSLEVSPHLTHDTDGTIAEARRLWAAVDRPNLFIKVPATDEGIPAIRQLISEGINVNITLLFGLPRYAAVADAYLAGLEARLAQGLPLERMASVASFFLSRIDVLVDPILERKMREGGPQAALAEALHGQVAIANAKMAYQMYQETFGSDRFRPLADAGARTQRLLWASTSTKNPTYSDVKYVEPLIGPDTINTMPRETLVAYVDHGDPASRLDEGVAETREVLARLPDLGIDLDAAAHQLEEEGAEKFIKPYDLLMRTLEEKRAAALSEPVDRQALNLNGHKDAVDGRTGELEKERFAARLWRKDPTLWSSGNMGADGVRSSLGWLHVAEKMEGNLRELADFAAEARDAGLRHAVLMGMGGSSLAPLVFQRTFTPEQNALALAVLDTTDPATLLETEWESPAKEGLFIVASKSGTTAEPLALDDFFFAQAQEVLRQRAGEHFAAITDPGTPLVRVAQEREYRRIFLNFPDIGGRYSALSYFGLVPAALMGLNVSELLVRALRMVHACGSCIPAHQNPGVVLGAALGELARTGRDKVTFVMPEAIATLGMWLEQLLAESTGKEGKGLVPIAGEPLGQPSVYGTDRVFVWIRLRGEPDGDLEQRVEDLRAAGHPVITIQLDDRMDLAQEFFRWEVATATAGAILGINPFDQPNVQESKENTNRLLALVRDQGRLPEEEPDFREDPLSFTIPEGGRTAGEALARFLGQAHPGDYLALMAYLTENPATNRALQNLRVRLRDRLRLATTVGYGPRFLHSTGQLHKGGPNTGLFLQLTADPSEDVAVPGQPYTFGTFKAAQAQGDLEALRKHGRRVMRIHMGSNAAKGLAALEHAIDAALAAGVP